MSQCITSNRDMVANFPPVPTTPVATAAGVNYASGKFATGINDTGGKFCHWYHWCGKLAIAVNDFIGK
jgi:hypothetical protein